MQIRCLRCRGELKINKFTMTIVGPNLEIYCYHCGDRYQEKLNKFCYKQFGHPNLDKVIPLTRTMQMQMMAKKIETTVSDYYDKDKRKRKNAK